MIKDKNIKKQSLSYIPVMELIPRINLFSSEDKQQGFNTLSCCLSSAYSLINERRLKWKTIQKIE